MKDIDPDDPPKEVKNWIRRLKRCLKDHPEGIWLYAASGNLCVMAYKDGDRMLNSSGGMDGDFVIDSVSPRDFDIDGGDW